MAELYSIGIYITSSSIHLSMDSGCFHALIIINNAAMNTGLRVAFLICFLFVCLFVSGTYSGVQLPGHMVNSIFTFLRNLHNVSTVAVPIYIPTNSIQLVHDKFWAEFQGFTDFLNPNHKCLVGSKEASR